MKTQLRTIVALLAVFLAGSCHSKHGSGTLIDRAAYPSDAKGLTALQDAVDAGGTIIIKGTFSLADDQTLLVGKQAADVTIKAHSDGATLQGGSFTVRQTGQSKMTLGGVRLTNSLGAYILVGRSAGTIIRDCTMTGLRRGPDGTAAGVLITELTESGSPVVLISGNEIDAGNHSYSLLDRLFNSGVYFKNVAVSVNATVRGNSIRNAQTSGVLLERSRGNYVITKNTITAKGDSAKEPACHPWATGIWVWSLGAGPDSFTATDNVIDLDNCAFAIGYGHWVEQSPEILIRGNDLRVRNCLSTMLTHGNIANSVWTENKITGSAKNAIAMIVEAEDPPAEHNEFDGNDISLSLLQEHAQPCLSVPKSHLYFSVRADNNKAVGFGGLIVVDEGKGNSID